MKSKRLRNKKNMVDKILFREKKLLKENQITYFDKFYGPSTLQKMNVEEGEQTQEKEQSNLGVSSYHTEESGSFEDSFDEDFNLSENSQGSIIEKKESGKKSSATTTKKAKSVISHKKTYKEKYFKKGFDIFSLNFEIFKHQDKKEIKKKFVSKKKNIYEPVKSR
jgi:hypothetical protein